MGGLEPIPTAIEGEAGYYPGQVASPSLGHTETNKANNHPYSHLGSSLESPINQTCMFLDRGRKLENP